MNKKISVVVSLFLAVMMVVSALPMSVFAATFDTAVTGDYYSVISKHEYTLAPGASETEIVLNNAAGSRRQIAHVMEVDTKNPTIQVLPGYYGIDKLDPNNLSDSTHWTDGKVTDTVKYYENQLGYNVVGAMNTALAYDSNAPYDFMMYNGVVLADPANHSGNAQTYLAIKENGDCELRSRTQPYEEDDYNVIAANFGWLVKDGALVTKTPERTTAAASRSMLGIKADGTLVICQVDGRVAPTAVGLSNYEMGEMMLALGCVNAVNGDGGGSSTFVTRREGEDTHTMRSIPSDGSERPTINSIIVVSSAMPTGVFDHSVISADYDFFAAKSTYTFTAQGIDTAGYEMDIPADVTWALSDASFGSVENGTFVSNGTLGAVDVQMVYNDTVVGTKTINVVNPDVFGFAQESTVIPYGKKVEMAVTATYGSDGTAVYLGDQFTLVLSDTTAATLDGNMLTATTDETKAGVKVTATYLPDPALTSVLTVSFGKGSEILYDFEDGDVSDWMGFDEAKQYSLDNGINNTLVGSEPLAGQYSDETDGNTFLATKENGGQVRNGEYALAWRVDNTNAAFASWTYNVLFNVGGPTVLRDVANGKNATRLGFWLYIPEGATGLAFQSQLYSKNANGTLSCKQDHYTFTTKSGVVKNLNSCTEADIPESRWVYASISLTAHDYLSMPDPADTSNSRSPSIIRTYIKPTAPAVHTFYIDDVTLDYSSAVDDRVLPTISDVSYIPADEAVALEDGATISQNTMAFSATVADNAELDNTTGKIYVDGIAVESAKVTGKHLICENITLTSGVHTVTFEIKDKLGNTAKVTKTFTVGGDALITLSGHNDSNAPAEYDSIYYVDINTSDIEAVDGVTATINLQTASNWEIEGINAISGYEATAKVNEVTNNLTVNVKKVKDTGLTGAQTLVSIPVRVWSWDAINHITGEAITPATQFATGNNPIVSIDYKVVEGSIDFADKAYDGYFPSFGGKVSVATNLNDSVNPWHIHDATLTESSLDATCTTDGYEGRTYCETCKSVIDWGTKVEANGHNYELVDGKFVCSVDDHVYDSGTGIFEMNGNLYYSLAGSLVKGWQILEGGKKCFAYSSYKLAVGTATINGITYEFDENGITYGAWVEDENGTKYSYGPEFYYCTAANPHANIVWAEIDGNTYGFDRQGYRHEGIRLVVESNAPAILYEFTDEGVFVGEYKTDHTGIYVCNGMTTYLENGTPVAAGLVYDEPDFYYINSGCVAVTGSYNCTRTNGILPVGVYEFGPDGKMLNPPQLKNGPQDDGYFYKNDVKLLAYQLVKYNGSYYFIDDYNKYAVNKSIFLGSDFLKGTEFLPGVFTFGADGKMVLSNGPQDDGYFYVDGVKQLAYQLVEFEGNYYFIDNFNKYAVNKTIFLTAQFLEGTDFVPGEFIFGADGKMIVKNGPAADGYFYKDGVKQMAYQLVEFKGDYYFIDSYNKYAVNKTIFLGAQFLEGTDFVPGNFIFGADGKMVLKNGADADGYFYKNGVKQMAYQLVEFEGDYYFIDNYNMYAVNKTIFLGSQFLEGTDFVPGNFIFGADGKMVLKNGADADGYFYRNGVKQMAYQLVEFEGDYYFIDNYNKYAVNKTIFLGSQFLEGTDFVPGNFIFGADGKMVLKNGPDADGYFYKNGVKQLAYQLVEFEGGYYFVDNFNQYAVNKTIFLGAQFLEGTGFVPGTFTFGADGRMVLKNGPQEDGYFYLNGVKQLAYQLIKYNGDYYFIDNYNKYAVNKMVELRSNFVNGTDLEPWYYTFGPDGKMVNYMENVTNGRDVGAVPFFTTTDGYDVKEGMLIRGSELDGAETGVAQAEGAKYLLDKYSIKTELDLRGPIVNAKDVFGADVEHKYFTMVFYEDAFTEQGKAVVKDIFTELSNPENYPIYIHCAHGIDRVGTVNYILGAVLGVSESNLAKEYMLSVGAYGEKILEVRDGINTYEGATLKDRAEAYLLDCGITQEQIDTLRGIYLEK